MKTTNGTAVTRRLSKRRGAGERSSNPPVKAEAAPRSQSNAQGLGKVAKTSLVGALLAAAGGAAYSCNFLGQNPRDSKLPEPTAPGLHHSACSVPRLCNLQQLDEILATATHPGSAERLKSMASAIAWFAAAPLMGYAANTVLDWGGGENNQLSHALGRRTIIDGTIQQGVAAFTQPAVGSGENTEVTARAYRMLVQQTENLVLSLPESQHLPLSLIDQQIKQALSMPGFMSNAQFLMRLRQGAYLSVPSRLRGDDWSSDASRSQLDIQQKSLVDEYPEDMHGDLDRFIWDMRFATLTEHPSRAQTYLYGPPGTGKTRFVHRVAETLGLPLCHLVVSESDDYTSLVGPTHDPGSFIANPTEDLFFGKIPRCFLETGVLNPILFFEELGERLQDYRFLALAKTLFDPDNRAIQVGGLNGLTFDYSKATVIFSGNRPMLDHALRQRARQITFTRLSQKDKLKALRAYVKSELNGLKKALSESQRTLCAELVEEWLPKVLQVDMEQKVPGVRIAQQAAGQLVKRVVRMILTGHPMLEQDVMSLVHDTYRQATP